MNAGGGGAGGAGARSAATSAARGKQERHDEERGRARRVTSPVGRHPSFLAWRDCRRSADGTSIGEIAFDDLRDVGDSSDPRAMPASAVRWSARRGSANRRHWLNAPASDAASCGLRRSNDEHLFGDERVSGAVRAMERVPIAARERRHQRPHAIGIAGVELRMREQCADAGERVWAQRRCLEREPLVEHQRLVAPLGLEAREERLALPRRRCG